MIGGTQSINQIIYSPRKNPSVHIHKKDGTLVERPPRWVVPSVARRKASSGGFMYAPKQFSQRKRRDLLSDVVVL